MTDKKITELFFARSEDAIRETDRKYGDYLRSLARSVLGSSQDSEECVNDAYLKLWDNIPPQKPDKLGAFAARIVRNIALNTAARLSALKRGGGAADTAFEEISECMPSRENVEQSADSRELARTIERFLSTLGREKQIIFLKRYWYFGSVSDIADEMGMSESKIKMTLLRTREKLRQELEKEGINI